MVTLVFSYYLIAYLLVPAALFRWFISLFIALKNFQRTKTQEITFAAGASLAPFFLAWLISWSSFVPHAIPVNETWGDRRTDYKIVYAGVVGEKAGDEKSQGSKKFWQAVTKCGRRQADFLIFYYLLVLIEAGGFAFLVRKYGDWKGNWFYKQLAQRFLLPHLSEWEILLTPFNFPAKPRLEVWLDVLTSDGVLFRGALGDRFLDSNGVLTGIILAPRPDVTKPALSGGEHSPKRFEREKYKRAFDAYPYSTHPQSYWRDIPGGAFFIPTDKILNLNVSYVDEGGPIEDAKRAMQELFEAQGLDYEIEPLKQRADVPMPNDNSMSESEEEDGYSE
jgi:hypothetical protein